MIISVDLDSEVPLYQQIRDRIVEAVADGRLRAGDPLPSTRQLASDLGINFHTVNKGYDALRGEGLLRLSRRTGAVVLRDPASGPPERDYARGWSERARTLLAEAIAQGMGSDEVLARCREIIDTFPSRPSEETASGTTSREAQA